MSQLQACPSCSRPYDVHALSTGSSLRCLCGHLFRVETPRADRGRVCGHCGAPAPPDARACVHCGIALESELCPVCYARSSKGAKHCSGCGRGLACQALSPLHEEAACPRCRGELSVRLLEDTPALLECASCTGLWIEPETFDALCLRAQEVPVRIGKGVEHRSGPIAYVPCLRCGDMMVRRQFQWGGRRAPIVLDHCRRHGVWLDADELAAVVAFVRECGARGAPSDVVRPLAVELPAMRIREKSLFERFLDWIELAFDV